MTTPIRPGLAPTPPIAPQRSPEALAAQRAFFQAAMDRAGAPSGPASASPVQRAPARQDAMAPHATSDAPSEPLPRPGRYLDIRV